VLRPIAIIWLTLLAFLVTIGSGFGDCEIQPVTVHAEGVTIAAAFSYTVHGLGVAFDDRSSGLIIAWAWSFGDPSGKVSNEKNPTFEYLHPGKYVVTLRITDASGLQDQISRSVSLGNTDTKTLTLGSGAILMVVGLVVLFRGEDNVRLAGLVVLVVGIAFLVSIATERDILGRLLDLFPGL
jgi:hypothetical protein